MCSNYSTLGYVYNAKKKRLFPVKNCSLKLFQLGGIFAAPQDYAFTFSSGEKSYAVQVRVIDSPFFYISKDWEAKIYERLCTFGVNGTKAWGASEWLYRNIEGRDIEKDEHTPK
ncbi:hypothetical protein JTB14_003231 [Gonioctena quinquepunctata]|nr:hypothetical protein JTB14_003231 [Gonioctena quinquepunctata]